MTGGLSNSHPLLQPEFIDGVVDSYVPSAKQYVVGQWFPRSDSDSFEIKWDEMSPLNFGLTLPVAQGAESPIIQGGHVKQYSLVPGNFREKYVLREDEITAIRRLGTSSEVARGQEIMARRALWLRERVQDRMEWLGWNAIFGQITVNQNNVQYTLTFPLESRYNVTLAGVDMWSAPASANPINDILDMVNLTRSFGFEYGSMWMNGNTAQVALQIAQFRTLFNSAIQGGELQGGAPRTWTTLSKILTVHIPAMPEVVIWDHGYRLEQTVTTAASSAQADIIVEDVTNFTAGMEVTIVDPVTTNQETLTLQTVTAATNTLTCTTNLVASYPVAATVRAFRRYIPDGKVLFMPATNAAVPSIGRFYMVPTPWGGELLNPKPGPFFVTHVHDLADPMRIELIGGFSGAPVPVWRNSYAILTAYS